MKMWLLFLPIIVAWIHAIRVKWPNVNMLQSSFYSFNILCSIHSTVISGHVTDGDCDGVAVSTGVII
jgi:hypothetical protein